MELYQIQYFRTLCMHKHFARAAEALYITPPTLTTAIKKLEKETVLQLIDRSAADFTLTPAGVVFLESANRILDEMDSLRSKLEELSSEITVIRLSVEHALCSKRFIDTIEMFSVENSNIDVSVMRRSGPSVRKLVLENAVNLGIVIRQPQLQDPLEYTDYETMEYGLFFPAGHELGKYGRIAPSMLVNFTSDILNLAGDIVQPLQNYFSQYNIDLQKGAITNVYNESVKRLIGKKLGMAILPLNMDDARTDILIRPFDPPLMINHVFVRKKANSITKQMKRLIDFLVSKSELQS